MRVLARITRRSRGAARSVDAVVAPGVQWLGECDRPGCVRQATTGGGMTLFNPHTRVQSERRWQRCDEHRITPEMTKIMHELFERSP